MGVFDVFKRKTQKAEQRAFLATQISRLTSDWVSTFRDINEDLKSHNLERLWARAKDLYQNNPYFRRYVQLVLQNVLGESGFVLKLKVYPKNDETIESAQAFKRYVINSWNEYTKEADATGLSWYEFQELTLKTALLYGEVFIRVLNDAKLQIIPPYMIDPTRNGEITIGKKKYRVISGVVVDNDREIAYVLKTGVVLSADEVIHWIFTRDFAEQARGYPSAAAIMLQLHHLQGFEESETIAARVSAAKMAVLTQTGVDITTDAQNLEIQAEPGQIITLPSGYDLKTVDWQYPRSSFADFTKAILRSVASGLGISYVSLANDLESVNYSSARVGLLEEREFYKTVQRKFVEGVLSKIFWKWYDYNLEVQRFDRKNVEPVFVGRRWAWVDPQKDIAAQIEALRYGLMSYTDMLASAGIDLEEQIDEIAEERQKMKEKGLILPLF